MTGSLGKSVERSFRLRSPVAVGANEGAKSSGGESGRIAMDRPAFGELIRMETGIHVGVSTAPYCSQAVKSVRIAMR
jgi:hypothetical protein